MTDSARNELGRVGIWTFAYEGQPAGRVRESAAEIEELGYGAIWFGRRSAATLWARRGCCSRQPVVSPSPPG